MGATGEEEGWKEEEKMKDEGGGFLLWEEKEIFMIAVSVEQAQEKLVEIIDTLKPGEEVEIRRGDQAVAKLVGQKRQRQFGLGKGRLKIVREDDAYLEDFRAYMP